MVEEFGFVNFIIVIQVHITEKVTQILGRINLIVNISIKCIIQCLEVYTFLCIFLLEKFLNLAMTISTNTLQVL
jgi:hypothetical protein